MTIKIRVAYYTGEGYFAEARPRYNQNWYVITGDKGLAHDYENPYSSEAEAVEVCEDFRSWYEARPTPVYTDIAP